MMKKLLTAFIFLLSVSQLFSQQQDFYGTWEGVLNIGASQLRIVFNISEDKTTLDSPDQNAFGIPATPVFTGNSIIIDVPSIQGTYTGELENNQITGTWKQMGKEYDLNLKQSDEKSGLTLANRFTGELKLPSGIALTLVLKIYQDLKGNLSANLDSPDQGAYGIPVTQIIMDEQSLKFEVSSINGDYSGTFNPDSNFYEGTWKQAGSELPLNLKENYEEEVISRPQEPKPPFPYNVEDVTFSNEEASVKLAGTFTYPEDGEKFPAVVLISGSGPQDRNEEIFNHKPFLVIADFLTKNGIAVLRYDDRGTAQSGGGFEGATTEDFAEDAASAFEYLKTRKEVDSNKIGLIGHSEGGLIAPIVANKDTNVDFLVLMAAPGLPGDSIILSQSKLLMHASAMPDSEITKVSKLQKSIIDIINSETDTLAIREKVVSTIKEMIEGTPEGKNTTDQMIRAQAKRWVNNWMIYFLKYDPRPELRKLKIPVLALSGENDLQVPPKENLPEIEKALQEAGNENYEILKLPKLNHLFQISETGSIAEYSQIEETISPEALKVILDFIKDVTGNKK